MSQHNRRLSISAPAAVPFALAALVAVATVLVVSFGAAHAQGTLTPWNSVAQPIPDNGAE